MARRFMSKETVEFVVAGRPYCNGKLGKNAEAALSLDGYKNLIRLTAMGARHANCWEVNEKPVYVVLTVRLNVKTSISNKVRTLYKKKKLLLNRMPTVNRIAELFLRTLEGVLYVSERQVVALYVIKQYSEEEGVDVLIGRPDTYAELNYDIRNS